MVIARAIVDKRGINKVPRYFVNPTLFSENAKMFTLVILRQYPDTRAKPGVLHA